MNTFAEVLELADSMSADERENLISILQSRLREERRAKLVEEIEAARREFAQGKCKSRSVDEIMQQVLQ